MESPEQRKFWDPEIETMPEEEMKRLQLARLKLQLAYNYTQSMLYRKKFEEAGLHPRDVRTLDDLRRLPLSSKNEHRRSQEESIERHGHPYGPETITCAPIKKIVRLGATSGTTGVPTLYTLTQHDADLVSRFCARRFWMAGIRPGHAVIQAMSLSMFAGGLALSQGIMYTGACAIPVGVEGGTKRVLDFIRLTAPVAIFSTPSFGLYLIEQSPKLAGKEARDLGIRWFFTAGEPGGGNPEVRKILSQGFGGAKLFDHTGGAHAFTGGTCEEPPESYSGMHFMSPDHCVVELIEPETKKPLEIQEGAVGEAVLTSLDWEGGPLMRYAYGDIVQIGKDTCGCGRTGFKFKIVGRADDMLIVKGVNLFPEAVRRAIVTFSPEVTGYFRILLDKPGPLVTPPLRIRIEHASDLEPKSIASLEARLIKHFRENLRVTPELIWVPQGTIPRETKKTKFIEIEPGRGERHRGAEQHDRP
jgi:phenylacetate-CoA ligase